MHTKADTFFLGYDEVRANGFTNLCLVSSVPTEAIKLILGNTLVPREGTLSTGNG